MNKTNLLLSAFILSALFLLGCSSDEGECEKCNCNVDKSSSDSVKPSSSSSDGGTIQEQKLVRKNVILSSDKSYADIDGEPVAYTKEEATNNLSKIDLIAHCGTDNGYCKNNNSIYRPYEIDLFLNPTFIGSDVFLFEIPPEESDIFRTATRYSEIVQTLQSLSKGGYLSGSGKKEIPIEKDKVFFVVTSEEKWLVVIIKATSAQSVDLEILLIPGN